jgi:hypothetical protein
MKTFYVTVASNHPLGPGCYEIHAEGEREARQIAFNKCPDGRWSFIYPSLNDVHPLDRGIIHTFTQEKVQ